MIIAIAVAGCSKTASPLTVVADNGSIPVPTIVDVSYSGSSITLQWSVSDETDITSYELYVKSPKDAVYSQTPIVIPAGTTSYSSSALLADGAGEYYFVLSAVNSKNEQGRSSNIFKFNFQGYKVSIASWSGLSLSGPQSIAVSSSKRVFIADTNGHRIVEVTASGNFVQSFGSRGSSTGHFYSPMGLAIDSSGRIVVADSNNDRIVRFDPDNFSSTFVTLGKLESGVPESGTELGEFNFPVSCIVGPSGEIYVSDLLNSRIQKIELANSTDFSGASISLYQSGIDARELMCTSSKMYVLDNSGHLYIKNFSGALLSTINLVSQAHANGLTKANSFRGVAIDESSQELFVSSNDGHTVLVFSTSGSLRAYFGVEGDGSGNFEEPAGMCFADNKLYVAEVGNSRVQVFR